VNEIGLWEEDLDGLGLDSFGLKTECRAIPELTPEAGTPDIYPVKYDLILLRSIGLKSEGRGSGLGKLGRNSRG